MTMRMWMIWVCVILCSWVTVASAAVLGEQALPEGGTVIAEGGDDPFTSAVRVGGADVAKFAAIEVTGEAFAKDVRIETIRQPETIYQVQLVYNSRQPVKKGDVLLAAFTARGKGTMGRDARIEAMIGKSAPEWDIFSSQVVSMWPEWQRFYLPATAVNDYEAGKVYISLRVGFDPQTVEIADAQLINYGQSRKMSELPVTKVTYVGREASASWRKAAAERIDKNRKGDLTVRVVNADGTPVRDAAVQVRMTRQAFPFASAVSAYMLVREQGPDGDRYRKMVDELFTSVTLEWEACQIPWEQDKTLPLDALKWLREHGKTVHGCHIVWPDPNSGLPKDVVAMKGDPEAMRNRLIGHIDEKVTACKGLVAEWNAVNELYTNRLVEETLGKPFIIEIFKRAKQIDPTLRLDMNDYGDMANPSNPHINGHLAWVQYMKEQGAPMDVVGLQGHFGQFLRSPDECYAILEKFAATGYPIHITELDINVPDEQLQADYMRDIMTVFYSESDVEKITLWGFWEGRHWLPQAALWRKDWSIKPIGQAWIDLVKKQWRTDAELKTDASGTAGMRAFAGDYEVTATAGGKTSKGKATVVREGATAVLRMP